jgi:hypothetical protein
MGEDCFNCACSASETYDITLDSGATLEGVCVCEDCVSEFENEDWIDVEKG